MDYFDTGFRPGADNLRLFIVLKPLIFVKYVGVYEIPFTFIAISTKKLSIEEITYVF